MWFPGQADCPSPRRTAPRPDHPGPATSCPWPRPRRARAAANSSAPTTIATASTTAARRATKSGHVCGGKRAELFVGWVGDADDPARLLGHRGLEQVAGQPGVAEALVPRLLLEIPADGCLGLG